ncbi:MAG: protease inhibitor I42 family protein [Phyllobacteriaceae bacterium]|nr:protease inhibitor I42 family protein [Phyllobacteriaceae bacterium]
MFGTRFPNRRAVFFAIVGFVAFPAFAGKRTVKTGNSWEFELEGNPSTGYTWRLDEAASSGLNLVEVAALGYRENTTGLLGAPAQFVFRLTCRSPGEAHLVFLYVGPTGKRSDKTHETWVRCD